MQVADNDFGVLVVEENQEALRAMRSVLSRAGYAVTTAASVPQARKKLSPNLDAVLIGTPRPDDTADQVAAEIVRRGLPCGMIFLSRVPQDHVHAMAQRWRAEGLLAMPHDAAELLATVDLAVRVGKCRKKKLQRSLGVHRSGAARARVHARDRSR